MGAMILWAPYKLVEILLILIIFVFFVFETLNSGFHLKSVNYTITIPPPQDILFQIEIILVVYMKII